MDGEETIKYHINQSFKQSVANQVILKEIKFPQLLTKDKLNNLTFDKLTNLTSLITFFIPTLLHTVSKIGMYGLLYILTYLL